MAQSGSSDPFNDAPVVSPRTPTRRAVSKPAAESVTPPVAPAAASEATPAAHHKSWKELAHQHNEERARQPQTTGMSAPTTATTKSATSGALSAVGALIVVIGLILVLARLFRRHAPLFSQTLPTEALEVLGRRYLDQRQSILLLRVGSRILVVGSSPTGLQGIGELSDPVEVDLVAGMCRPNRTGQSLGSSFFNLIKGHSVTPERAARTEPPRRTPSHRAPERDPARSPEPGASTEAAEAGGLDPDRELIRRLRGGSSPNTPHAGAPYAGPAEVFRD